MVRVIAVYGIDVFLGCTCKKQERRKAEENVVKNVDNADSRVVGKRWNNGSAKGVFRACTKRQRSGVFFFNVCVQFAFTVCGVLYSLYGAEERDKDGKEMETACKLLGIPISQVGEYFFYD